jgi:hypothetical protein
MPLDGEMSEWLSSTASKTCSPTCSAIARAGARRRRVGPPSGAERRVPGCERVARSRRIRRAKSIPHGINGASCHNNFMKLLNHLQLPESNLSTMPSRLTTPSSVRQMALGCSKCGSPPVTPLPREDAPGIACYKCGACGHRWIPTQTELTISKPKPPLS